jgi:type II secretory pathway pseudopilin PulG
MKISIVASAILFTAAASTAMASTVAEREYQRGYDDCSQGRYDQNQHGESYKKGCRAAEDGQPAPAAAGSHGSKAKISDLKGMDSIKAFDVMTSRGFTNVDTLTAGETIYGIYYNAKTHQCVQLANANDRVDSAVDIHEHPKCR